MLGFQDILNADPSVFTNLAAKWSGLADSVAKRGGDWSSQVSTVASDGTWTGPAATSAGQRMAHTGQQLTSHESTLRRVATTLQQSSANFAAAKGQAVAITQQAARLGLSVSPDGQVSVNPRALEGDAMDLPVTLAATELIGNQVAGTVRVANEADQRAANALGELMPGGAAATAGSTTASGALKPAAYLPPGDGGPGIPAPGTDPAQVKQWWDSLTVAQQQQLADQYPQQIGSLNGVPCAARDYANRKVLDQLIATTTDKDKQAALLELRKRLGPALPFPATDVPPETTKPGQLPQRYLLGIDTQDTGHMILATGNPDAAHNVVTMVPGVGTKLDKTNTDWGFDIPGSVYQSAQHSNASQTTATIWWDGYNAPGDIPGAASSTPAQQGAPALDAFQQGLRTTHTPTDNPHSVLIGHSYGSTVVGEASKLPGGLHANDVIAIGSPGMDVSNANALGVGSGHVWAARAMDDPIPFLNGLHGTDPCDPFFGANTFDAGTGGAVQDAHGSYFNNGPALTNMGNIITGNTKAVTGVPWWEHVVDGFG